MKFTAQKLADTFASLLATQLDTLGVDVNYNDQKTDKGAHVSVMTNVNDDMPDMLPAVERMLTQLKDKKTLNLRGLLMPQNCEWCALGRSGNVVVRMVRMYDLNTDRLPLRFDIRWE
ncbi:hypothetical protein UFOVP830_33 [uncultured Caudovirales phage]|uniref:Uncharacterized protein n=1 Tax=uncultured Caudovirales phage TaxID=2100421 RepID=A0A6J5NY35_9CAUD|nr:hypothetical protein UFOVP830_33 [uncultured Caudovirales phage]